MKKLVAILLTMLMVTAIAVGCGNGTAPAAPGGGQTPVPTAPGDGAATPGTGEGGAAVITAPQGGEAQRGGILRLANTAEGATPLGVPWEVFGIDATLMPAFGESLLLEGSDGSIEPWLAEEFWVDMDTLQLFFQIRQGVYFHDGSRLNAEVAAWNITQAIETNAINPAIISAEAIEEYLMMAQLDRWSNIIWSAFASRSFTMISMEAFLANGIEWARENPISTGPFVLREYIRGERIVFDRNENYWIEGKPYLDGIEIIFIRDVMTQNLAFQATGDQSIDILGTNSAEQVITLRGDGVTVAMNQIGPISLVPSSGNPDSPLAILEVRQAISYAIDREAIVGARGFGLMTPAFQYIPEEWPGVHLPPEYNLSYNPDRARELLAEAGFPDGFSTVIVAMPGLVDRDAIIAVQAQLREVGIDAEVQFPDAGGYSALRFGGWEGLMAQHTRSFPAPFNSFNMYFDAYEDPIGSGNLTHQRMISAWRPLEEVYELSQAAQTTEEPEVENLANFHRLILREMLCIPLWNLFEFSIMSDNVRDTGFAEWSAGTQWQPQNAWIAQD